MSNTTIRLDFDRDHFGGRETELEQLKNLSRIDSQLRGRRPRCRIFFIQGDSGMGKSSLVEQAYNDNGKSRSRREQDHVLARAKFEDSSALTTPPLQAWMDATISILTEMKNDNDFRIHLYQSFQKSSEQSADYLSILSDVLGPKLKKLFEIRPTNYRGMVQSKKVAQQSFLSLAPPKGGIDSGFFSVSSAANHGPPPSRDSEWSVRSERSSCSTTLGEEGYYTTPADKDQSFARLRVAYREFYRVICQYTPVVLFFDDIQWAEPDDFKIMETILDDPQLEERLIFVGCHRPVSMLHGLSLLKKPGKRTIRTMTLGPLLAPEMTQSLQKLLKRDTNNDGDDEELLALVAFLESKTGGNPFFMRQMLETWQDRQLLQYSTENSQWEWDLERIQNQYSTLFSTTSIASNANVLELVSQKIKQSSPELSGALSIAAFLGSTRIDVTVLIWILEQEMDVVSSEEQLHKTLLEAVQLGLVDRISRKEYRFAHDRIRESALLLLPSTLSSSGGGGAANKMAKMHLRVGLRLRSLWEKNPTNDRLLFQVATQLNSGKSLIKTTKERFKLAQLNFQAAEAAMKRSSFYPAVHFLRRTKELLETTATGNSAGNGSVFEEAVFDFLLQTETALARMEFACGLLDKCITRTDAIIKIAAKDDKVKVEAMQLKASCFTKLKKPSECLDVAVEALSTFGVQYPRKFVQYHIRRLSKKAKNIIFKNRSDDDILSLAPMIEERYQLASECLRCIAEMAVTSGLDKHQDCCILNFVELSFEKGRNAMTAQTLASWGRILSEEGDIAGAYRFGRLAMKMAEDKVGGKLDERVPSLYYSWHHHLRHPYEDGVEPFSQALKNLWAHGALEGVVLDTSRFLRLRYLAGLKLMPLLQDMRQFRNLCNDFDMTMAGYLIDPFAQMVQNLVEGPGEEMLRGEFMTETTSIRIWQQTRSKVGIQLFIFHKMVAAYYFNCYTFAAALATKLTDMYVEGADNLVPYRFFFRALAAWTGYGIISKDLSSSSKRCRFLKLAKKMTAQVQKFVDAGVINCNHSLLFLQAEQAAAQCQHGKHRESVETAYQEAIAAAFRRGCLYDQALANERAGEYFIKVNDKATASTYLQRAHNCYTEWEASAKATQMVRKYGGLVVLGNTTTIIITDAEENKIAEKEEEDGSTSSSLNSTERRSIQGIDKLLLMELEEMDESGSEQEDEVLSE